MRKKIWTAFIFIPSYNTILYAQHKNNIQECIKRCLADDEIWARTKIHIRKLPKFSNKHFRNSLAMVAKTYK